jgi:hypothetical protein
MPRRAGRINGQGLLVLALGAGFLSAGHAVTDTLTLVGIVVTYWMLSLRTSHCYATCKHSHRCHSDGKPDDVSFQRFHFLWPPHRFPTTNFILSQPYFAVHSPKRYDVCTF